MIEWKKLNTSILTILVVGCFGFFIDFQFMKNDLAAVESDIIKIKKEMERLDEIKELQCEVAIFLFKDSTELQRIVRHCK